MKTIKFDKPKYVGDAINTVRIYNEKEVDELIFLDICATNKCDEPNFSLIEEIASECFMPFTYGGGVNSIGTVDRLFSLGVEKVAFNTACYEKPELINEVASKYGAQSVVASIDVKKNWLGKYVLYKRSGKIKVSCTIDEHLTWLESVGVGEILLTSINQDGTMDGYDLDLINYVSKKVSVPLIACGGAGELGDFNRAVRSGADAVATGSLVVFQGKNRAVLTRFPTQNELEEVLS